MEAARQGDRAAAEDLLARGADINARAETGLTALLIAIVEHHPDIAQLLIEKGADVNVANSVGLTPLFAAMSQRDDEMVQRLKKAGAKTGLDATPAAPKHPSGLPQELLRQ